MEKSEWYQNIESLIEHQETKIRKKDYKFFQIDRLLRVAERIDEFSANCDECKSLKPEIEDIAGNVAEFVNGAPSKRRELEKRFDVLMKHLKDKHEIYPVYYFMSLYSLLGIVIGGAIGGIAGLLIPDGLIFGLLSGFTLGVIIGYMIGSRKDLKARVAKKLI